MATSAAADSTSSSSAQSTRPLQSNQLRFVIVCVTLAAIGIALTFLREIQSFVAPVFLAFNFMITAYPLYRWFVRKKVPAPASALMTGLVVFVALIAFVWGFIFSIAETVSELPKYADKFNAIYKQTLKQLDGLGISQDVLQNILSGIDPSRLLSVAGSVLNGTREGLSLVAVLVVTLAFMAMDMAAVQKRLAVASMDHSRLVLGFVNFAEGIRRYWLVTTVFGLIVAVIDYVMLLALGVPLALVWGLFSFLTNYIPNIGFFIGLVPPALLALVDRGPVVALIVVVAYIVINFIVQSIIQPKFAGDAVGLSPIMSFLSLLLWAWVFGPLGALIALPSSLLVKALLVDIDPNVRWTNILISSRLPEDTPEIEAAENRLDEAEDKIANEARRHTHHREDKASHDTKK